MSVFYLTKFSSCRPSSNFIKYIHGFKEKLNNNKKNGNSKQVNIIIGNEACDADSAVCALAYSYYMNQSQPKILSVPVLNIKASDYKLKTEVCFIFSELGLLKDEIVFVDGIAGNDFNSISLVDHNIVNCSASDCLQGKPIVKIIDHHVLADDIDMSIPLQHELIGSCASLVASILIHDHSFDLPPLLAVLLLDVIVLDTLNFDPEIKKFKSTDLIAAESLRLSIPFYANDTQHNKDKVQKLRFDELVEARSNVSGLSCGDLLLKDAKIKKTNDHSVIVSSVPIHLDDFMKRDGVMATLAQFSDQYSIVVIMSLAIKSDKQSSRQIAFHSTRSTALMGDLVKSLDIPANGFIEIPELTDGTKLLAFHQNNRISRKQILPAISQIMDEFSQNSLNKE